MATQHFGPGKGGGQARPVRPCDRLIAKLSAAEELSEADQEALHSTCGDAQQVRANQHIIRAGDKPEFIHIMVEGWAARAEILEDSTRQITAFLIPGDFCDLHITILGEMDHDIVALTDAKVAFVPHKVMEDLPRQRPELGRALWWATLVDEAVLRAWISNIGRRDAYHRVAHLFCELHARLKLVGLVEDGTFSLPMTQEAIADAQGLTPVHVNRTLQALRRDGLIELSERTLKILDVARLQKVSGFDPAYLHRGKLARR